MTDGALSDRLAQLRARWEADPTSRIFLQLAEEHRHLGRVKEALAVLEKGLKEHPGYLSALVAKGRCHLELGEGEPARAVLERVVKQDATQMVANKLLVRAYLETGEPGRARERLDLYTLLNDSDPEIDELRRRIKTMERPAPPPPEEPRRMDADPFLLEPLEPAVPRRKLDADVFDIDLTPAPSRRPPAGDVFQLAEPAAAPVAVAAVAVAETAAAAADEEPDGDGDLVFPGLASRDSRRRYLEGLDAEGLFSFAAAEVTLPPPGAPPIEALEALEATEAIEEPSWLEEIPVLETAWAPPPPAPHFAEPQAAAPAEEDLWAEEPLAAEAVELPVEAIAVDAVDEMPLPDLPLLAPPAAQPTATATLGALYLRQGYRPEAERIFREVLEREPDNSAARSGLEHLASLEPEPAAPPPLQTPPLDARQLLAGFRPAPGQSGSAVIAARKVHLLIHYLKRLRRESELDVS